MRMTGTQKSFEAWVKEKAPNAYFYRNTLRQGQGKYSVAVPELGINWFGDAEDANEARILAVEEFERRKNPVAKRYFLYDVLNDYSIEKVNGKSDFGTLAHAKTRAVKDNRGESVRWKKQDMPGMQSGFNTLWGRNKHNELIYILSTHGMITSNPKKRKKNPNWHNQVFMSIAKVINDIDKASKAQLKDAIKSCSELATDYSISPTKRAEYRSYIPVLRKQLKGYAKNPCGRKKNPEIEIHELILWAENSPHLSNQFISIMKNLTRKHNKGKYDSVLAAKLWKYWVDEAVKDYNKEVLGGGYSLKQSVFSIQDRKDAAVQLEAQWLDDVRGGEYLKFDNPSRRKNTVGAVKPRGFIIATFIRVYNSVGYALDSNGARMDFRKGNAKVWKTKSGADKAAQKVADGWGDPVAVFPINTSEKQIESLIGKSKVK